MVKRAEKEVDYSDHNRIVFVGKTGHGKSSSINSLIGTKILDSKLSSKSVTYNCQALTTHVANEKYLIVDTPGLFDTERKQNEIFDELKNVMEFTYPGIDAFVIVINVSSRFTKEEQETIDLISKFFGKSIKDYGLVMFTRLDDLERDGISLESFIRDNETLYEFVKNFDLRYVGFNNTLDMNSENLSDQRKKLFDMVKKLKRNNNGCCYTTELFKSSQKAFKLELERIERMNLTIEELNSHIDSLKIEHNKNLERFQKQSEAMMNQMKIATSQEIERMKKQMEEEKINSSRTLDEYKKILKKKDRKIKKLAESEKQISNRDVEVMQTRNGNKDEKDLLEKSADFIKSGVDLVAGVARPVIDVIDAIEKFPTLGGSRRKGCF